MACTSLQNIYSIAIPIRQSLTVGTNSSQDLTLVFAQYNVLSIYRKKCPLKKASEPKRKSLFHKNNCWCNQYLLTWKKMFTLQLIHGRWLIYDWVAAWGHIPCTRPHWTCHLRKLALGLCDVQLGWDFDMWETLTQPVNCAKELVIYGPGLDLWPLNFGP